MGMLYAYESSSSLISYSALFVKIKKLCMHLKPFVPELNEMIIVPT